MKIKKLSVGLSRLLKAKTAEKATVLQGFSAANYLDIHSQCKVGLLSVDEKMYLVDAKRRTISTFVSRDRNDTISRSAHKILISNTHNS